MPVFRFEIKKYMKSAIIWSLVNLSLFLMFMAFYPIIGKDAKIMDMIMEHYPEELLLAMGMSNQVPLSSVLGFFSFSFVFVQLCLAIQASNYGFHGLSVEERELTADFLMAKPIKRQTIYFSKVISAILGIVLTSITVYLSAELSILLFRDGQPFDRELLQKMLILTPLFQLVFMGIGLVVSVLVRKVRSVLSFSMALVFSLYILNAIRGIINSDLLGYFTPFYHFEAASVFEKGTYNPFLLGISITVIIISLIASYILYLKRDIHAL